MQGYVLVVLLAFPIAAPAAPKLRLAEVQQIAPERYRAELTVNPDRAEFAGAIQITLRITRPTDVVWLNANQLTIQEASATEGGKRFTASAKPEAEDFVALQFDSPLPAGTAELRIRYTGKVHQRDTSGLFRADDSGNYYLLTQFEETYARDVFPCFDEPSYKTPWQLTLRIPRGQRAVSNTAPASETDEGGEHKIVFAETKPLPSYLIALGVGPFEFVDAGVAGSKRVPVRIVTPKGRASEAKYAAEVTATILTRLEEYFGIPYPYEKSDQVAVPVTTGFGAMENAGMVTYGQTALLAKPESDSVDRQRGYAMIAAHELAHQWFGDLVTTAWWDDIWLNEAFATWMEQKLIAAWKPEWNSRVSDVSSKLDAAVQDSLASARKIRQEIETKDDISNAFDSITYLKGAAVIGMFESWIGEADFRKGVQSYLRQYAFRNATSGEFLDSLSTASKKDVTKAFSTFLNQPGLPILSVQLNCTSRSPVLHLEQSRYVPIGSRTTGVQTWSIPVCVRYGDGKEDRACTLMSEQKLDLPLEAKSCPAWVQANDGAKGYYAVNYKGGLLRSLAENAAGGLSAAERVELIGNAQGLATAGQLPIADALKLAESFRNDSVRQVVQGSVAVALSIDRDLVSDELRPNYERFLQRAYGRRAQELGWTERPGDSDDIRLLRPVVVSAAAGPGASRDLAQRARELSLKWLDDRKAMSPNVAGTALAVAARYGDAGLYRRFLGAFKETKDRQDQQRLMGALRAFRDPVVLEIGMREVAGRSIPLIAGYPLLFAGQGYRGTNRLPFEFVKSHFDEIMRDNPTVFGFSFGAMLPYSGGGLCDAASRKEMEEFFKPLTAKYEGAPRNLAQTLENIDLCIARVQAQRTGVAEFLKGY